MYNNRTDAMMAGGVNNSAREMEILELENAREDINREIEELLVAYKKLTGKRKAVKGAKKIGKSKKDYSYWHRDEF